jgi:hypothetical protein
MPRIKVSQKSSWGPPHTETQWTYISNSPLTLLRELHDLYWLGVERDLQDIISTLQIWQQQDYKVLIPTDSSPDTQEYVGFKEFVRRASGDASSEM